MVNWNWPKSDNIKIRRLVGLLLFAGVVFAVLQWYSGRRLVNPATGRKQYIALTPQEEVRKGLHAAPQMAASFGGLHPDEAIRKRVKSVGNKLVARARPSLLPFKFDFHILADSSTINAFALPGGQIFITAGLLGKLKTDDQLAVVLGHEIGHVIGRHAGERLSEWNLIQGGADTDSLAKENDTASETEAYIASLAKMRYGLDDEQEADVFAIKLMRLAEYDPGAFPEITHLQTQESEMQKRPSYLTSHPGAIHWPDRIKEIMK
ncbi:Beta-barrel assembly-enhancing protease [Dyadobacter sp. CECT 9275]|uniref:Beta-barrel assembly-enhancing protease n=1 Tax=Dyadobacter helix TaxID=2822344 RepID=A0A916NM16_9BACT|nr:M48 family metalloprotease [Dyadobacter sp. CECT 9275]CAG5003819.1 Beta-barrel assembly-enhancing protease [Dyadobacter sp. CECT 9275]